MLPCLHLKSGSKTPALQITSSALRLVLALGRLAPPGGPPAGPPPGPPGAASGGRPAVPATGAVSAAVTTRATFATGCAGGGLRLLLLLICHNCLPFPLDSD